MTMDLARHLLDSTYVADGALFWVRTQRPVDPQVFKLAGVEAPACQDAVVARYDLSVFRDRQVQETPKNPGTCTVIPFVAVGRSKRT